MFSIMAVPICIPTNSVGGSPFLHTLSCPLVIRTGILIKSSLVTQLICRVHTDSCAEWELQKSTCLKGWKIRLCTGQLQFISVAQSCLTLCNPMNRSTPGLPVHHQRQVCSNSCPLSQWCHPSISSSVVPFSSCLQPFPASGSFQMSQFFASGGLYILATHKWMLLVPDKEKAMATHSSTLAWEIPWTEEPGRLQSMGW